MLCVITKSLGQKYNRKHLFIYSQSLGVIYDITNRMEPPGYVSKALPAI